MKVGIMSDTHDALQYFSKAVHYFEKQDCKALFHGGDFVSPFAFKILGGFPGAVYCVFGNNEGERVFIRQIASQFDNVHLEDEIATAGIEGKRFLIKHRPDGVENYAHSGDFDYVLYGHTHKIDIRRENSTAIINPGEACGYLSGRPTIALLNTDNDDVQIIDLI